MSNNFCNVISTNDMSNNFCNVISTNDVKINTKYVFISNQTIRTFFLKRDNYAIGTQIMHLFAM